MSALRYSASATSPAASPHYRPVKRFGLGARSSNRPPGTSKCESNRIRTMPVAGRTGVFPVATQAGPKICQPSGSNNTRPRPVRRRRTPASLVPFQNCRRRRNTMSCRQGPAPDEVPKVCCRILFQPSRVASSPQPVDQHASDAGGRKVIRRLLAENVIILNATS